MSMYSVETRGQLQPFLEQEWLLTNGLGGFSASSILGCNTRRYHGLLVAATLPPVGRIVALSRIGEIVHLDGRADELLELSIAQFRGGFHPRGDRYLKRFELGDTARFEFVVEGVHIVKEVRLLKGRNVVGVRYTIEPDRERLVQLRLLPFVILRDFHSLNLGTSVPFSVSGEGEQAMVAGPGHVLRMRAGGMRFVQRPDWWRGLVYAVETQRGQDDIEDLFVPGEFVMETRGKMSVTLWAGTEELGECVWEEDHGRDGHATPDDGRAAQATPDDGRAAQATPDDGRDAHATSVVPVRSETMGRLYRAAGDFVVCRRWPGAAVNGTTVIAGYPWFSDWGRDTMISLPGLLLTTGRFAEAAEVLRIFAQYVADGMIPNCFDDYSNKPHYNTVDASLWFIHAAFEYLRLSGDKATFEQDLLTACGHILRGYRDGTQFNIGMDERDGLIHAGDANTQLTWMDAKYGGVAFTPRHGKAVEINALWYNALRLMGETALAERVGESFRKTFWYNPFRGLYDVVEYAPEAPPTAKPRRDAAIRPNQIFAVSLPHSPLTPDQQSAVVEVVRRELLTPYGLRTLSPGDPGYKGRYTGPQSQRDPAYHNGTVWAWLMGPFLEAYLRVNHDSAEAVAQARQWLSPLLAHMEQACIGQISEVFDGDPPHHPGGAFAQAWSVAEVLRLAARLGM